MAGKSTHFRIVDNSGLMTVKCLHVYHKQVSTIGTTLLVVARKHVGTARKFKKKMFVAVVVQLKKPVFRSAGAYYCRFDQNAVLLLTPEKDNFIGTRFFTPIVKELRSSVFRDLVKFSRYTV